MKSRIILLCSLLSLVSLPVYGVVDTLIPFGAEWKYLDDGSDQGAAWSDPSFDDSSWASGPAELGYGDGDEVTVLDFGGDPGNKFPTYYFRHSFFCADPSIYAVLQVQIVRDDSAVVYLNGTEVWRSNLPEGPIDYLTFANGSTPGDGKPPIPFNIPLGILVSGDNVLAIEIHQHEPSSSDISLDVQFIANTENTPPSVSISAPSENAFFTAPAVIPIKVAANDSDGFIDRVAIYRDGMLLTEDTSAPYEFDWVDVPVGNYVLTATATDNLGAQTTTPNPVNVSVGVSTPPLVDTINPVPGSNLNALNSITVTFSEAVSGVTASDLLINGLPASSVSGSGFTFIFSTSPTSEGTVFVSWNGSAKIVDFENPPKPFDPFATGSSWQYTLNDNTAPVITSIDPPVMSTLLELNRIKVTFSEPVQGVNTSDLRINGVPSAGLRGFGAGPYTFDFAAINNGLVNVTWAATHGITDQASPPNAFVRNSWSYVVNTNLYMPGQIVINEIMYHPSTERIDQEWIELHNTGSTAVNLTGWTLNRGVSFTFPSGTSISPQDYLVVAADVAAFNAQYSGVANVVGGWIGRLSNSRDDIELEDANGNRVDLVEYADEGDFATRIDLGGGNLDWITSADGLGSSLELVNPLLPNNHGQNWLDSAVTDGTPGNANSSASANMAPMILNTSHFPLIPRPTDPVTITAEIVDESISGLNIQLFSRDITGGGSPNFIPTSMFDDGAHNDGTAGDGVFGTMLSSMPNGSIIEYYIQASDPGANLRTWPAPVEAGGPAQIANALYQVDDEAYAGKQPVYRLIMSPEDRDALVISRDRVNRNVTFITVEGATTELRHNCGVRRRGASSFGASPPTMKFTIPTDRTWNGKSSMNLNSINTYSQVLGSALALKAGLPTGFARAVQLRFNGINEAPSGGGMFGSYAHVEVLDGEWARDHFPNDGNGNVYSKRRPECGLEYRGTDPGAYIGCAYDKESNASENDWSDLANKLFAMDPEFTPDNDYVRAIQENINVELWHRYFTVLFLMNYNETALANGADDDYNLYRGIVDPRFMVLGHDFDSIFGSAGNSANNIFLADRIANVSRFLHHPTFEPLFLEEYRFQVENAFHPDNLYPLMDQVLGDWVPGNTIQSMKDNASARRNFVLGQLPAPPNPVQATIAGEPDSPTFLNSAVLTVGGNDITHYMYRVNGGSYSSQRPVSNPINLSSLADGSYTVFVVGRNSSGTWQDEASATISKTWTVLSSLRGVVINEILAVNNSAVNHEGTFPDMVELYNAGSSSINLSGKRLTDNLNNPDKFEFGPGTSLASGNYLRLYANDPDGTAGIHLGFTLSAEGESLYLIDSAANGSKILDQITFGLQLPDLSVGRLPNGQWGLTSPTLGSANMGQPTGNPATLKINEWLARGTGPLLDDFIELYNPDPLPVSLNGLHLTDHPIGDPFRHPITPLSFMAAFSYQAFIADSNQSAGADHVDFRLDDVEGEIALVRQNGSFIDCVIYGQQQSGISMGRSPNGGSNITFFEIPTPGAGNPLGTEPPPPIMVNLIASDATWSFDESGSDLGDTWKDIGFDDSGWPSGPALLGEEVSPLPEPIRTPVTAPASGGPVTTYYRTHFNFNTSQAISGLEATLLIDDAAVLYLNGNEVARFNMPPPPVPIAFDTLAPASHEASVYEILSINPGELVNGDNLMAVEVHQSAPTSSDTVFGLALNGLILSNNAAGIVINEVLANPLTITNLDGTMTDWVELYNPTDNGVDLSNASLTDDIDNSRRWVFPPASTIPAQDYLVIRFDANSPATTNFATVINTGFGLDSSGDEVYLFTQPSPTPVLLDGIVFGIQAEDFSIGRSSDGALDWVLTSPTANSPNIPATLGNSSLVKINEWMAAPATGDDWFELYNPNAQPVSIGGLYLTDDLRPEFLLKHALRDLSFMAAGLQGFQRFEADDNPQNGGDHVNFGLKASGESIGLSTATGTLIHSVTFGPQMTGVSEGFLPDGSANLTAFPNSASPGRNNFLPIPNVVINEVLTHSDLPYEDAIELHNISGSSVNVSGWFLSDSRDNLKRFRIPNGNNIPANGFAVFYENQFNLDPGNPNSFALSSAEGDRVILSAATSGGNLTGFRAEIAFGPAENGVSFGRYVTSAQNGSKPVYVAMSNLSFGSPIPPADINQFRDGIGAPNPGPKVGPVVVSEIMYHPVDFAGGIDNVLEEFVELTNISGTNVNLFDGNIPTNTWRLRDAVKYTFPPSTILPVGGVILVTSFNPSTDTASLNAFRAAYGLSTGVPIYGPYSGKLDNSSDSVELVKPDPPQTATSPNPGLVPYILVDQIKYFDLAPWPTGADGLGLSLQRNNLTTFGDDPVNWTAATPTPGPNASFPDTDNDSMDDDWELMFGLNPNDPNDASLDLDGDGLSNVDEFRAGTLPNDRNSVLALAVQNGSPIALEFQAQTGKSYTVYYQDALNTSAPWQILSTHGPFPSPRTVQIQDNTGGGQRFYRLSTP